MVATTTHHPPPTTRLKKGRDNATLGVQAHTHFSVGSFVAPSAPAASRQ